MPLAVTLHPGQRIEYWDVRFEIGHGAEHAGSIHEVDGLWVPVCRAWHRLPGHSDVPAAVKALHQHLNRPRQPGGGESSGSVQGNPVVHGREELDAVLRHVAPRLTRKDASL